ncbi:MAG: hypothetical protein PHW72_00665 [Candidatus Pacebacteria bacterium]|nr:hypothetical protein [Candidatus Paceibacterota bacterium]
MFNRNFAIIISLSVFSGIVLGLGGSFAFQYWQKNLTQKEQGATPEEIEFQEGFGGDFPLNLEKTDEGVFLSWPLKDMKVTQVRVFNLGDPKNSRDHKLVFFTSNFETEKGAANIFIPEELERNLPQTQPSLFRKVSDPDVFISSPYKIGDVPEGFYDNTYPKADSIFEENQHYLIEVVGVQDGTSIRAEYFLIFNKNNG